MRYDTVEDLKVTLEDRNNPIAGVKYSHPSHGMIRVSRYTGGGISHFGSEIETSGGISVVISECETRNDLGRNWYYDSKVITEVSLSYVQYAELISNPNTQGVPCTIKYTQNNGHIKYEPINTVVEHIESELEKQVAELKLSLKNLSENVNSILNKKGTLNKADKEAISSLVGKVSNKVSSTIPFYEKCLTETLESKKMEAQTEIESVLLHAVNRLGIDAIKQPEVLTKLLEDKS